MRKRERFPLLVFVCLLALSVCASAQESGFSITPSSQFLFEENFIRLNGITLGTESTVVRYSLGEISAQVDAQPVTDPNNPNNTSPTVEAWVPGVVVNNAGIWSVQVFATDTDQTVRTYGPVSFTVNETPTSGGGATLPEVVVGEAETAAGGHVTFDVGSASCDRSSGD